MPDSTVSAAGMRVVKLLAGRPPQTVADLIKATGVTRTAVTEQLNELVAAGFVQRSTERLTGRGRPRHLYSVTAAALTLLFVGNQYLLVPAMLRAIEDIGGRKLRAKVLRRVSLALANHYKRRIDGETPEERIREMVRVLCEDEGHLIDVEQGDDGHLMMHRRSCSFFSMFEESRSVCSVDKDMMSIIAGTPVRRKAWRHDGAPCCVFEIGSNKKNKAEMTKKR